VQNPVDFWPTPPNGTPPLLDVRDRLAIATINGARHRLDHETGSLTPGKEADIIVLEASNPRLSGAGGL
jgi:5-methylthioadenosine/S-adenosylhomocysteine deaminase